jgi:glycosyltransferase involved in cell wall biosynthesis
MQKQIERPILLVSKQTITRYPLVLSRLLVGFANASIPVVLVCPPEENIQPFLCGAVEIVTYPVVDLPLAHHFNRKRLIETLSSYEPSVLHCLCETRASMAAMLARHLDIPYILNVNSIHTKKSDFTISTKRCLAIACATETIASSVRLLYKHDADRVRVIRFGAFVDDNCCSFSNPDTIPSIVMACDLDNAMDFECLFQAIYDLIMDRHEFTVVIMGQGKEESLLRRMLIRMNLLQVVTIIPQLQPWRSVLSAGDIFLMAQPLTRFSSFLLEAMSVGAAVAACKGGVDDMLINTQSAVIFDPDDNISIRFTLQALLDRHELARNLGMGAQDYIRINHSVNTMVQKVINTYHEASEWSYGLATIA